MGSKSKNLVLAYVLEVKTRKLIRPSNGTQKSLAASAMEYANMKETSALVAELV
jgi:hypothetical protein